MSSIPMPFGQDPTAVLLSAIISGVSASDAGGYFITRNTDYLLTVPDSYDTVVQTQIIAKPVLPDSTDASKDRQIDQMNQLSLRLLFDQENRLRILEAKQPVSVAQFRKAIRAKL